MKKMPKRMEKKFEAWLSKIHQGRPTDELFMYAYNLAKREMLSCKGCTLEDGLYMICFRCRRGAKDKYRRKREASR